MPIGFKIIIRAFAMVLVVVISGTESRVDIFISCVHHKIYDHKSTAQISHTHVAKYVQIKYLGQIVVT